MRFHDLTKKQWFSLAGALLLIAGTIALMGIITAETLYPGYNTADRQISDLGASEPPNSIILQPSATIFDLTMAVTGTLVIVAAFIIYRATKDKVMAVVVLLFGIGALGVGIFNGSYGSVHAIFAMITFSAGALSAILAYRVTGSPFRYISFALGAIALLTLVLYLLMGDSSPFMALGIGGLERWVAYPEIIWVMGCGGYLCAKEV